MKKYQSYIIGAILLIGGVAIGWLLKPQADMSAHAGHNHESNIAATAPASAEIWTCSMHPQVRQDEFGICPICEMDLIVLDNSMGSDDPTILKMSNEAAKLAQVETFIVGGSSKENGSASEPTDAIQVDGTIQMDERTIKSQTSHIDGRIDEMAVTFEGQYVSAGQKIATLYSTELLSASQELITAAAYNDRIEGLQDAAIQKLKNWKISDTQINNIIKNGTPIETVDIYADYSGYVLDKKLNQGDHVRLGQALYTIGKTSNLWLVFDVFESDLAQVSKGSKVVFTTASLPGEEFNTRVSYIDPMLNNTSRTATVRAEINNKGNKLKPGMLLSAKIKSSAKKVKTGKSGPVKVPNSAILWTGERSVVYVQLPDEEVPTFQFREVDVTNRSGGTSTISSGVEAGERVVTHGAFAVDAAAQLNNNMSMINRDVTIKVEEQSDVVPSYIDDTPVAFKEQLDQVASQYIILKDALVDTDGGQATEAMDQFSKSVEAVDMSLLKGEAHTYWMSQLSIIKSHGDKIGSSSDVEDQRKQFSFLSVAMINAIKAFGTNDKTYYVQYCPMALDNTGASWIAKEDQIRNPYFGDKMMKCGVVKLELN